MASTHHAAIKSCVHFEDLYDEGTTQKFDIADDI